MKKKDERIKVLDIKEIDEIDDFIEKEMDI